MSHDLPIEKLFAYRDQELTPAEQETVQLHLAQCPTCQESLNEIEAQGALFQTFREAQAPLGFTNRVMDRLQSEPTPFRRWWNSLWVKPAFGRWALASGLVLATALTLWMPRNPKIQPVDTTNISIYFSDANTLEDDVQLGTKIEEYFL
jgi:anti-sigma factor RsiW